MPHQSSFATDLKGVGAMHSMRYYSGAIRYSRRLQYRAARTLLAAALMGAGGVLVAGLLLRLA